MDTKSKTLTPKEEEIQLKEKEEKKCENSITIESITSLIEEIKAEIKETKEEIESLSKDFRTLGLKKPPPEVILITPSDNQNTTEIRKKEIIDVREEEHLIEAKFKEYPTVPTDSMVNIKLYNQVQVKQKDNKFLSFLKRTKRTIKKYVKKLTVLILLPVRSAYKSF